MSDQPNILFLLSDEHSYRCFSHLDPSGAGEPVNTPTFDAMAARGVAFDNAYCQVPLCTPSRICMLTGLSPMQSGGWGNSFTLKPEHTVASTLRDAGYETCLIGKMHLGGRRQFVGFNHRPYGDLTGETGHQWEPLSKKGGREVRDRTLDAGLTEVPEGALQERVVAAETIGFLREHRHRRPDQPWFLCASFSRPHFPLNAPARHFERYWPEGVTPPKVERAGDTAEHPMTRGMVKGFRADEIGEEEGLRARAAYFACVDWLDEIVGDMLAALARDGLLENTIIVYTSDHGELMGEHGVWWKNSWHEGAARVPWFVQLPEHRAGGLPPRRLQTPVSLADLYPTLCGFAGATPPDGLDGINLSEAIRGGGEPQREPVWLTNPQPRWGEGCEHVVVRDGRYKYVKFRGVEPNLLFDLETDPLEQHNLVVRGSDEHREVAARLDRFAADKWDFDAAEKQAAADEQQTTDRLPAPAGSGNLYHWSDGRLIDADPPLYQPDVVIENPADQISDYPAP